MDPGTGQAAASRGEILVCGCAPDDLEVLRSASGPEAFSFRALDSPIKLVQQAAERSPLAVILGVCRESTGDLDMISVIRTIRRNLPVIVVAQEDSLALERRAREEGVFYYLVHPLERSEVEALFRAVIRHEGGRRTF